MDWNSYWWGRQDAQRGGSYSGDGGCAPILAFLLALPLGVPLIVSGAFTFYSGFSPFYCAITIAVAVVSFFVIRWVLFRTDSRISGAIGAVVYLMIGFLYRRSANGPGWEWFAISEPLEAGWDWLIIMLIGLIGWAGFYAIRKSTGGD